MTGTVHPCAPAGDIAIPSRRAVRAGLIAAVTLSIAIAASGASASPSAGDGCRPLEEATAELPSKSRRDGLRSAGGHRLFAGLDEEALVVVLEAASGAIGPGTTVWINADGDAGTGHAVWDWAVGAEFNINIGASDEAGLFTGAAGEEPVAPLACWRSADGRTLLLTVPAAMLGRPAAVTLFADINDAAFLPENYAEAGLLAVSRTPEVYAGIVLDGRQDDWQAVQRLDTADTGAPGAALFGTEDRDHVVLSLASEDMAVGPGTTIWLDTDRDPATGQKVWGWAAGAEFNVNFGADGVPALFTGGAGETRVGAVRFARDSVGQAVEIAIPRALIGTADAVTVYADVNDIVFLPTDYAKGGYLLGTLAPVRKGSITLDARLDDWTDEQRLDRPETGAEGYRLYGDIQGDSIVLAIAAPEPIGMGTTAWLDTDGDPATGYHVFGGTVGAEFKIELGPDGLGVLSRAEEGATPLAIVELRAAVDQTAIELAVPRALLGDVSDVTVFADINDTVFLPKDYAAGGYRIVVPTPRRDPGTRGGAVPSALGGHPQPAAGHDPSAFDPPTLSKASGRPLRAIKAAADAQHKGYSQ